MSQADITPGGSAGTAPAGMAVLRQAGLPDLGALVSLAAALALGVGLILWSVRPDWVPAASQDGSGGPRAVLDALAPTGIEHRMDPRSGLVLVRADRLGEVRMALAAAGVDADATTGVEMLDREPSLGTSHYTEVRRYQHALETELARTLSTLRNVESARVHLALPTRSVFVRDREGASASVTLRAEPGRTVEDEQVDAVVRLVASSIAYLEPGDVTVVDQWGQLLSSTDDADGANRAQYRHARQLERLYASRIEALLTPIVGAGRIRATVTADIDFSENESTEEQFAADPAKLRSEQTQSTVDGLAGAIGIPGALVNQPPGAGTVDPTAEAGADAPAVETTASSATRNYELDRTIIHSRRSPGTIRRLSAAVVVDDRLETDENGESVKRGLEPEEIEAFTALAQQAIGFDAARGDTVTVTNRAFMPTEALEPIAPLPIWQQPWLATVLRQVFVGLAVLLLVFVGVRPALKKLTARAAPVPVLATGDVDVSTSGQAAGGSESQQAGTTSARGAGSVLEPPQEVYGDILNMARAMASEDPKRVARLVKDWVADG